MAPPSLQLLPATPTDTPAMATCFFTSHHDITHPQSAFYKALLPRTATSHAFCKDAWSGQMQREPDAVFLKVIDTNTDDKLVGFAKWRPPSNEPSWFPPMPEGEGEVTELREAFFGSMKGNRERVMGGRPHWYFDVLGVDAAYARQGVGAMLVAEGCRRADEDGLEAYLASTPAAMKLYQRFGFEAREEQKMPPPNDWYVRTLMVRSAKKASLAN